MKLTKPQAKILYQIEMKRYHAYSPRIFYGDDLGLVKHLAKKGLVKIQKIHKGAIEARTTGKGVAAMCEYYRWDLEEYDNQI